MELRDFNNNRERLVISTLSIAMDMKFTLCDDILFFVLVVFRQCEFKHFANLQISMRKRAWKGRSNTIHAQP